MARPLRVPQPTSSVARLLDLDAAARAVSSPRPSGEPTAPTALGFPLSGLLGSGEVPNSDTPRTKRELVLTRAADDSFTQLVEVYRRATGTRLTTSHVARAVLKGVAHCFDQLEKHARRMGPLKLPSNAAGRTMERERFEARIADAFIAGIRASSAMDGEPSQ